VNWIFKDYYNILLDLITEFWSSTYIWQCSDSTVCALMKEIDHTPSLHDTNRSTLSNLFLFDQQIPSLFRGSLTANIGFYNRSKLRGPTDNWNNLQAFVLSVWFDWQLKYNRYPWRVYHWLFLSNGTVEWFVTVYSAGYGVTAQLKPICFISIGFHWRQSFKGNRSFGIRIALISGSIFSYDVWSKQYWIIAWYDLWLSGIIRSSRARNILSNISQSEASDLWLVDEKLQ
jgi:hypothetical protein